MRRPIRVAIGAGAATLALAGITGGVVLVGRAGAPSPSPTPVIRVAGVDVSSHNRQIPWGAAATSGIRFVIARATEGATQVDRAYATVREQATAAGLAFTAFHFARPDRTLGDAEREAEKFVLVSKLSSGDLVPVLDLEASGSLGVRGLQIWTRTWLEAVGSTLGVKPLIYTNADFWMTHMGNTTSFADAGYGLFVASWGTAEPVLPAFDWGGHGRTMWQTTRCGKVPGIPGCLDRDVFNGAILSSITIP